MPTSQCVGAQDSVRENLASHTNQPAEQSVLPPLSGILTVDEKLKLSKKNYKQKINYFFEGKAVPAINQLKATPAFPTPYVLAQFASKVYTGYEKRQTDDKYAKRLALPVGWKLLTTASNTRRKNGYFGAAYWHPAHQQVVIAHRGTELTNLGANFKDIIGALFKHHVPQMNSASTFACMVVEVLRDVNKEKGTNFQVFFTGHSLGGWLAQITTFTTEYLKVEGNTFLKSDNVSHRYHPHTVVFDSPGCKEMLSQMTCIFDVSLNGRPIELEHLDITSYLSAPNLINTCNKHVGTVYRIFVDLSDVGFNERHTALYNLATHNMDKIVKVFDSKTGQVHRDEQGQLKIQVVKEWPISGFRRGKEYKSFFKWAEHLNDYHTEITYENFRLNRCYPIPYKTKNYDECVTSTRIFSQEERQFLESYSWLRQLPEFFKPTGIFSAMKYNQAQHEAVAILQGFEIENETIRCTDASELQVLLPYVKRLLQLFPQLKENTEGFLVSQQKTNNFYQFVTKRYVEEFRQSPLEFKPDFLSSRNFLNSDEHKVLHLRIFNGDAWTGLIKVYQVVKETPSMTYPLIEGNYTVLTLEHLLHVNQIVNLNTLIESTTTPHLLMMACETNQVYNDETKQIFESLFNTLKQTQSVKVILTTQSEDDTVTFLLDVAKETLSNGFVTRDEQVTLRDLTPSSQENLFENAVNFQGSEIAFNQLISPDSPVTNVLLLADLLKKKHLDIGKEPVAYSECNFYGGRHFIDRTFHHQVIIKQDVLSDSINETFPDLIASNEQDFKQRCLEDQTSNVHWLEGDKSGKLVWQQSQGSLETLRKYIDTHSSHTYTPDDLMKQAQHQRVMLISDTAGMGKSTVLTHLSTQIKQKFPVKWVVRIYLKDHTEALEVLQEEELDEEKAINFLSEKILKLETRLEMELFKQCCEQTQKVNIVIMLDGFDEISPSYKETVFGLLEALRQTAVEQMWVTTRPHLRKELEEKLQQLSYTLEPFSEENQVEFLTKCWSLKDWFIETDSKWKVKHKVKLQIYAEYLIEKIFQSISDNNKAFTGIPLQCWVLAEEFDEDVKKFCQSAKSVSELPSSLELLGLYKRFMKRKYDICFEKNFKISMTDVDAEVAREQFVRNSTEDYQILAMDMLFTEEQVALLQVNIQCTLSAEKLAMTGIVQVSHDGKLHFIHRTFAEYYVAKFLVNQLTKWSNTSQQLQDLLLQKIFLGEDYRVVRTFIDGLLSETEPSNEVLKQYGSRIHDLWGYGVLILHQAATEGNAHIIGFLLDSLKAGERTDIVNALLLAEDKDRKTVFQVAAMGRYIQVLDKLWKCAIQKLETQEY